jgi:hypothetical protein
MNDEGEWKFVSITYDPENSELYALDDIGRIWKRETKVNQKTYEVTGWWEHEYTLPTTTEEYNEQLRRD